MRLIPRRAARARPRLLFVLKWRAQPYAGEAGDWGDAYGGAPLESGLYNSARLAVEALAADGLTVRLVHVRDANAIHRELVAFAATHVIIEAFWVPPGKFDDLARACPDVRFTVRNHSQAPFLALEGMAFGWMAQYLEHPNVDLAPNAPRMVAETRLLARRLQPAWSCAEVRSRVPFLPNLYPMGPRAPRRCRPRSDLQGGRELNIGCFGAVRPLKNHMAQALGAVRAALALGRPLAFHINAARVEMGGAPVVKNLRSLFEALPRARLVEHPWQGHGAFRALVRQMDLICQVSFSETFNIVAADAASQGVPVVGSAEIPWLPRAFCAQAADSGDIARVMLRTLGRGPRRPWDDPARLLARYGAASLRRWRARFG